MQLSSLRHRICSVICLSILVPITGVNGCRARDNSDVKSQPQAQGSAAKCRDTILPLRDYTYKNATLQIQFSTDGSKASYLPIARGNFGTVPEIADVDAVNLGFVCGVALTFDKGVKGKERSEYFTLEADPKTKMPMKIMIRNSDNLRLIRTEDPQLQY